MNSLPGLLSCTCPAKKLSFGSDISALISVSLLCGVFAEFGTTALVSGVSGVSGMSGVVLGVSGVSGVSVSEFGVSGDESGVSVDDSGVSIKERLLFLIAARR